MGVGGKRLDLLKKEKKATKHAAQNVASREQLRLSWCCILKRTAGVIGSFAILSGHSVT